jgi:hypothetical protein
MMRLDPALRAALLAALDAHTTSDPAAAVCQAWTTADVLAIAIARAAMLTADPRATGEQLARVEAKGLGSSVAIKVGESLQPLAR